MPTLPRRSGGGEVEEALARPRQRRNRKENTFAAVDLSRLQSLKLQQRAHSVDSSPGTYGAVTSPTDASRIVTLVAETAEDCERWVYNLMQHGWLDLGDGAEAIDAATPFDATKFESSSKAGKWGAHDPTAKDASPLRVEHTEEGAADVKNKTWWEAEGLAIGVSVTHPTRGHGIVVDVTQPSDDEVNETRVHVQFDIAKEKLHRYNQTSWMKKMTHHEAVLRVMEGMLRQRDVLSQNKFKKWTLFRMYSDGRLMARVSLMSARELRIISIPHEGYGVIRVAADDARRFTLVVGQNKALVVDAAFADERAQALKKASRVMQHAQLSGSDERSRETRKSVPRRPMLQHSYEASAALSVLSPTSGGDGSAGSTTTSGGDGDDETLHTYDLTNLPSPTAVSAESDFVATPPSTSNNMEEFFGGAASDSSSCGAESLKSSGITSTPYDEHESPLPDLEDFFEVQTASDDDASADEQPAVFAREKGGAMASQMCTERMERSAGRQQSSQTFAELAPAEREALVAAQFVVSQLDGEVVQLHERCAAQATALEAVRTVCATLVLLHFCVCVPQPFAHITPRAAHLTHQAESARDSALAAEVAAIEIIAELQENVISARNESLANETTLRIARRENETHVTQLIAARAKSKKIAEAMAAMRVEEEARKAARASFDGQASPHLSARVQGALTGLDSALRLVRSAIRREERLNRNRAASSLNRSPSRFTSQLAEPKSLAHLHSSRHRRLQMLTAATSLSASSSSGDDDQEEELVAKEGREKSAGSR